jgi:creatinine amidohydrolase
VEYEWARLRADELCKYAEDDTVVILPVAALEQHGPHLPVMVDSRLAEEVSKRTASLGRAKGIPIITLPVVWHGLSEHHMPYGGTVTLTSNTFFLIVRDLIKSISRHGFSKFLILNGHGGNITAAEVCAQDISMELSLPIVAATYWLEAADRFAKILETQTNVMHACEAETSMMMALEPNLVVDSLLNEAKGPMKLDFLNAGKGSYRWRSLTHVTSNGVIGDPSHSSSAKGEQLLREASQAIFELICDPETFKMQSDLRLPE